MRIAHVVQGWAEQLGGGPRYFREISFRAAAAGHDISVLTTNAVDGEYFWRESATHTDPGVENDRGVRVQRFPVRHLPVNHWKLARALALAAPGLWGPYFDPPTPWVPDLHRYARRTRELPQIVHATGFPLDSPLWAGRTLARRADCPLLLTPLLHFGRGEQDVTEFERFYSRPHQQTLLRESSVVFVLTEIEGEVAVSLGARPEAVCPIGIGIEPAEVTGGDGEAFRARHGIEGPILLHIATRAVAKGSDTVLEAARRLWERGSDVTLVMAGGSMPCFRECLETVRDALPADRFIDLGYVSEDEKRDALAAADAFALPSRADAFGIVFLEAWMNEVPVIGARAGGIPGVIDEGRDGLLVEYADADGLADAVERLLVDREASQAMARVGREKVLARYTWDEVFARVLERYEACVGRGYEELPAHERPSTSS